MTLRSKIREITTYHSNDGTSGYLLSEKQIDAILDAVKEIVLRVPQCKRCRSEFLKRLEEGK